MIAAAQARLADVACYIGQAPSDAPEAYVVLYPSSGLAQPERYAAAHTAYSDGFTAMAVSTSPSGVKRLIEHVRDRITGWTPPGDTSQGPLFESVSQDQPLADRVESETRWSLTITYRASRRRKVTP